MITPYQTWQGPRRGATSRWLAIPKFTYMDLIGKRGFVVMLTLSWVQFILRLVYIYLLVNVEFLKQLRIPSQALPPINAFFFKNLIDVQLLFCFIFAFLVGSGLISRDMQNHAVVLFFTKPISRWEYFFGKFFSLFGLMMAITWGQAMILFALQWAASPAQSPWRVYFWKDNAWIVPAITIYSGIVSATISLMILAASSLSRRARYAGIAFAVYVIGTLIVGGILSEMLHRDAYWALSPLHASVNVGNQLFRLGDKVFFSPWAAWAGLAATCGVSALILWRRLEGAARLNR